MQFRKSRSMRQSETVGLLRKLNPEYWATKIFGSAFFKERRCPSCASSFMPSDHPDKDALMFFCSSCAEKLSKRESGHCNLCGNPHTDENLPNSPCGRCIKNPPPWHEIFFHATHQGLLRELILRLKYKNEIILARPLGSLLAFHTGLSESKPDIIIPIPLHSTRLSLRGFNQSVELGKPMAKKLAIPLEYKVMTRTRATIPQPGLSFDQRHANIKNAFAVSSSVNGLRVLLIDDVMTSGATMRAATETLLEAGAESATVCVLSRKGF